MKKKLKILALFDAIAPTTLGQNLTAALQTPDWKTEAAVLATLKKLGHAVEPLALFDDLTLLHQKLERFQPDLVFNLCDQFRNNRAFDQNIVALLEMIGIPFTGCGSTALTLCKNKAISKHILGYHGIRIPRSVIVPRGERTVRPPDLGFPLIVKPLKEEASYGISHASVVYTDRQCGQRVRFIHEKFDNDAIAEEYIAGREFYVSLIGQNHPEAFPIRELVFKKIPASQPNIATYRAKWDESYRQRAGIKNLFARGLTPALKSEILKTCKSIYQLLNIDAYARIDLRVTDRGEIYFIEANPNPILAPDEDFAQAARKTGINYSGLIDRIIRLGVAAVRD